MKRRNEPSDFWARVKFGEHDQCWIWTGATNSRGYGILSFDGEKQLAHRLAVKLSRGEEPEAVCHSCDMPACCNPAHLISANRAWNCHDRWEKGRNRKPGGRPARPMTLELELG